MEAPNHNFIANGFVSHNSGPQVAVDRNQVASEQDVKEMYPWKIWYFDSETGLTRNIKPIEFFQPNSNAAELLAVYDSFAQKADDYTGIPAYTYGSSDVGKGASTATGLSMLMSNAAKGIKYILSNMDADIVQPSVEDLYQFNMMYCPDESIKGDLKITATGVMNIVQKESMAVRRNEFAGALAGNPIFMEVIGKKGIANLLREVIATLDMPSDSIVPSEQEIEAQDMQAQIFNQIQQALQAIQMGQATPDDLVAMLMQVLGQPQAQGQGQDAPVNKGTPAKPVMLMADGAKAGGVDQSSFVNSKRPPVPPRPQPQ